MKRFKRAIAMTLVATSIFATGCSNLVTTGDNAKESIKEEKNTVIKSGNANEFRGTKEIFDTKNLQSGMFYVRHANNVCEPLYWGNSNVQQGNEPNSTMSLMWFQTDFNEIPTLYDGDTLIYYSETELPQEFSFTRFEYFGYSVGICGLRKLKSDRLTISTDSADYNTFPGSDADGILYLKNDEVILESIGGVKLRYNQEVLDALDAGEPITGSVYVTRVGTIQGLKENTDYDAVFYSGTNESTIKLKADKIIMAYKEKMKSIDYEFNKAENVITLDIPETYAKGYYVVNGAGMFRYAKGTEWHMDDEDFNEDNLPEEIESKVMNIMENEGITVDEAEQKIDYTLQNEAIQTFNVQTPGILALRVTFTKQSLPEGVEVGDVGDPEAYVEDPLGTRYTLAVRNGEMYLEMDAKYSGKYKVVFSNLYGRLPKLQVG